MNRQNAKTPEEGDFGVRPRRQAASLGGLSRGSQFRAVVRSPLCPVCLSPLCPVCLSPLCSVCLSPLCSVCLSPLCRLRVNEASLMRPR